jgi:WD40 repeat protein
MEFKQLHWLDITEFLAIGAVAISVLVAIASGALLFPILALAIALLLNLINRLRFQYLSRRRLSSALKQLQRQLSEEIQAQVSAKTALPSPVSVPQTQANGLANLPERLLDWERSIQEAIQSVSDGTLPERIDQLEQAYAQLKQETKRLSQNLSELDRTELRLSAAAPSPPVTPASSLRAIALPPVSGAEPTPAASLPATAPSWHCLYTLTAAHDREISALAISPDGQFLASVSWDQTLKLWDLATGHLCGSVAAHAQGLLAVVFTGCDRSSKAYHLATGSFDQSIKLWSFVLDAEEKEKLTCQQRLTGHTGSIHALAAVPESQLLVSGSYDQTIKQWQLPSGDCLASSYDALGAIYAIALGSARSAIAAEPVEQFIASGGGDGRIVLWSLETGERLGGLAGNVSSIESLAISLDGQTLAAGCVDGSLKLWQLDWNRIQAGQDIQPVRTFSAHTGSVKSLVFNASDRTLVSSGADGTLKLWHPHSRDPIAVFTLTDEAVSRLRPVLSLALSAKQDELSSAKFLAAGAADGSLRIWQQEE